MITKKFILGSEEWCGLPQLKIPAVKAKIDTGAKTSSIHAVNINPFEQDGIPYISFDVYPIDNTSTCVKCVAPIKDKRLIKSSFGDKQLRYVISTTIKIDKRSWEIELTLSNRRSMGYKMLIGKEAISPEILIDPNSSLLFGDKTILKINKLYKKNNMRKTGLHIALLASNPALYSNRRIIEAGENRGHKMSFLNIKQCYMKLDNNLSEVHYRGGKILNDIDAIIPRIRPSQTFYGCSLVKHFETMNIFTVNKSDAIRNSRDKLYSLQCLQEQRIEVPVSGFANSPVETNDLIEMIGGSPLVIKLLQGAQGRGVVLAETKKAAESVINGFKVLKANLLVQEFIKEADGEDIRCFVLNGKVISSIKRSAAEGEFRANLHLGGKATKISITREARSIAIKACKALGLDVAGIDIINSSRGPLVLEVNSSPGLEGIEAISQKDIASMLIEYIEKSLKYKNKLKYV